MDYAYTTTNPHAKVMGISIPVSTKHSMEVCRAICGKSVTEAKKFLEDVADIKKAVPYMKYHWNLGHKAGMGPGRYPVVTCKHILELVKSVEANAQHKGLRADICITHASAHTGPSVWKPGRQGRRQAKRTHIQIVVEEAKPETKSKNKKPAQKVQQ